MNTTELVKDIVKHRDPIFGLIERALIVGGADVVDQDNIEKAVKEIRGFIGDDDQTRINNILRDGEFDLSDSNVKFASAFGVKV